MKKLHRQEKEPNQSEKKEVMQVNETTDTVRLSVDQPWLTLSGWKLEKVPLYSL